MSDFLLASQNREPLQESFSDEANPLCLDGVEFIEYITAAPQASSYRRVSSLANSATCRQSAQHSPLRLH